MSVSTSAARADRGDAGVSDGDERTLVQLAQGGDPAAFDQLVRLHLARAVRVARRIVGTLHDAEDVVQDAFVLAHGALGSFDTRRPFAPWLLRIVVNTAISSRRSWHRRMVSGALSETLPSLARSPVKAALDGEIRERFRAALAQLPERQRIAIQLFEVEGFSSAEIGEMLGVAEGTVRWHVHAARKALRAALSLLRDDEGGTHAE